MTMAKMQGESIQEPDDGAIMPAGYFSSEEMATINKITAAIGELKQYFVEREEVIEAMADALLCKQHVCEIGPPGTAKSYLIECFTRYFAGFVYFAWQFTKFTTPEEVFGPYSLPELKAGNYTRITDGKLPHAHVAYFDEVFNANSSILNAF